MLATQLCLTLCDPMDCSLPGFFVHGIFQARVLEWVAISFSRDLPDPGIEPQSTALQAMRLSHQESACKSRMGSNLIPMSLYSLREWN